MTPRFSPATQAWFDASFSAPTAAQDGAWDAIGSGSNALVVAPTGSGKTLAAFLWSIDRLASEPPPADRRHRCRVLYVSPMKALAVDVERNLRAPLTGIRHAATRLGLPEPDLTVGVRSGDTPADERRRFGRTPPDILITTPESLFLILTSQARESLRGVETVIVDEVHAVAGTKRGAHLALSLERLDQLLAKPAQRIGLSATVRPVEEVARFLGGAHDVEIVQPPAAKQVELEVVVPVEDLGELGQTTGEVSGSAAGEERRTSIWPHVEERIVDLVSAHRSTIVFANSRRLAERLCARLNEINYERVTGEELPDPGSLRPAAVMAQAGSSAGPPGGRRASPRSRAPTTGRCPRSSAGRSRRRSRPAGCPPSSPRRRSSSASTWAPSTSSSRSSRRRRSPAACSGSAAPATRSARCPAVSSSPSTAATSCRPQSSPSGCATARSRPSATRATRSTCSPSRSSRWCRSRSGTSRSCSTSYAAQRPTAPCRGPLSSRCSTCWPGATRATSSPSCGRDWCGTAWAGS